MVEILVLVGATASGKTSLLEALFGHGAAREGEAEVISADSMQAYRGMDIGTAKPGPELRAGLPHHLLDLRDPDEQFTAGDFVRLADEAIEEILARGRRPVISGGTGFYIRNLLLGLPSAPPADPALRAAVAADLAARGPEALRAELAAGDPASAARIHERDLYRLTRAVEILRATGRPLSDFLPGRDGGKGEGRRRRWLFVNYRRGREELAARIAARVDLMFEAGLPDEVEGLRGAGYGRGDPGMKAIGYSEFFEFDAGDRGGAVDLAAVRERIVLDSQRYAKRQETFFRGLARDILRLGEGRGEGGPGSRFRVAELEARDPTRDLADLEAILRDTGSGTDA